MPLILLFFNVTKEASSLVYTPTHSFKLKCFGSVSSISSYKKKLLRSQCRLWGSLPFLHVEYIISEGKKKVRKKNIFPANPKELSKSSS